MALDHCKKISSCLWLSYYRLSMSILDAWIFWEKALCWKIHCGVQCAHLLFNSNNTCCLCLVVITLQPLFVYSACMDILGNGIISHFGVYSAHLLCNGNNSCCLCLTFTISFIYNHQLPMVLEDSNESSAKFNSDLLVH